MAMVMVMAFVFLHHIDCTPPIEAIGDGDGDGPVEDRLASRSFAAATPHQMIFHHARPRTLKDPALRIKFPNYHCHTPVVVRAVMIGMETVMAMMIVMGKMKMEMAKVVVMVMAIVIVMVMVIVIYSENDVEGDGGGDGDGDGDGAPTIVQRLS